MLKNAQVETVIIPIETIVSEDRMRQIDSDYVDFLSVSMDEVGLRTPVWVQEADQEGLHQLIAGAHRLEAARRLGWREIRADVFSIDGIDARMLEIDENLFRRELTPLDRAVFLAERKELYEARNPETRRGGDRRSDQTDKLVSLIPSFAEETAVKLGVDARTIFRAIARANNIVPDVQKKIAVTWIAAKGAALDAISRLEPEQQRAVVALLLQEGGPRTVPAALAVLTGEHPTRDSSDDQYGALLKAWRRAGSRARDLFTAYLAAEGAIDAAGHDQSA